MNTISLTGRLTQDPDLRYTNNNVAYSFFTLAVDRNYTNKEGEKETDFLDIVTWRGLAETCVENLNKGRLVGVEGTLQIRENQKDGTTYKNPQIVAENVEFLDYPEENNTNGEKN